METDLLPGLWSLSPLGALIGVIVLFYWLLTTGRIIPRASHERELAVANKRGDEWKESALEGRELIRQQSEQITKFADASKTPAEFFGTVMRAGGGANVATSEPSDA